VFVKNLWSDLGSGSQSSHQTYCSGIALPQSLLADTLSTQLKRRLSRTHAHIHITQRLCSSLKERTQLELPVWRRIQSFVLEISGLCDRDQLSQATESACWSASASLLVRACPCSRLPLNAGFAGGWLTQWKWASLGRAGEQEEPGDKLGLVRMPCRFGLHRSQIFFSLCLKLAWDILQRKRLTLSSPAFLVRKGISLLN